MRIPLVAALLVLCLASGCTAPVNRLAGVRSIGDQLSFRIRDLMFELENANMNRANPAHIRPPQLIHTGEGIEDWRPDPLMPRREVKVIMIIDETGGVTIERMDVRGLGPGEEKALRKGLERMRFYPLQIDAVPRRFTIEVDLEV